MKKPIIALILAAAILFGLSAGLNGMAQANARAYHLQLMQTLLPGATEFTAEPYAGEDANIRSVHKSDIGFVVETSTYGYAGNITMLVGVNNAGKVTGVVVRDAHETFGLGGNALTDHVFLAQFLNKTGSFEVPPPARMPSPAPPPRPRPTRARLFPWMPSPAPPSLPRLSSAVSTPPWPSSPAPMPPPKPLPGEVKP